MYFIKWEASMLEDMQALEKNRILEIIDIPEGNHIV